MDMVHIMEDEVNTINNNNDPLRQYRNKNTAYQNLIFCMIDGGYIRNTPHDPKIVVRKISCICHAQLNLKGKQIKTLQVCMTQQASGFHYCNLSITHLKRYDTSKDI